MSERNYNVNNYKGIDYESLSYRNAPMRESRYLRCDLPVESVTFTDAKPIPYEVKTTLQKEESSPKED